MMLTKVVCGDCIRVRLGRAIPHEKRPTGSGFCSLRPGGGRTVADLGAVDPDVTVAQEAFLDNEPRQTQEFTDRLRAVADGGSE